MARIHNPSPTEQKRRGTGSKYSTWLALRGKRQKGSCAGTPNKDERDASEQMMQNSERMAQVLNLSRLGSADECVKECRSLRWTGKSIPMRFSVEASSSGSALRISK